jgi:ferric-dicitrate binding protein FerR (iron transport regulator)
MKELFKKYLDNQCSPDEVRLLLKEFEAGQNEDFLRSLISQQLEADQEINSVTEKVPEKVLAETYDNIKDEIRTGKKSVTASVIPIFRRTWFRVAAAAILVLLATGTYLLLNKSGDKQQVVSQQQPVQDIAPGGNKAVLTLADGSTIILDNAANGTLTKQGNTKILKQDGQLAYNLLNEKPTEVLYNTITTPRGGQYQLVLSDGSKVWLNAASSIRFPAAFIGKERKVEITGEAYFEVAKNAAMPFKVNVAGKGEVEVLGTHFNINSYADEATINTTLLEGSVKVSTMDNQSSMLKPGQQAQISNGIKVVNDVEVNEVIAWKNGLFNFNGLDIENIMRQISRWYDVDISYEGKISKETYSGIVSRNSNVSQVLKIMEEGGVKFSMEGKRMIVLE